MNKLIHCNIFNKEHLEYQCNKRNVTYQGQFKFSYQSSFIKSHRKLFGLIIFELNHSIQCSNK